MKEMLQSCRLPACPNRCSPPIQSARFENSPSSPFFLPPECASHIASRRMPHVSLDAATRCFCRAFPRLQGGVYFPRPAKRRRLRGGASAEGYPDEAVAVQLKNVTGSAFKSEHIKVTLPCEVSARTNSTSDPATFQLRSLARMRTSSSRPYTFARIVSNRSASDTYMLLAFTDPSNCLGLPCPLFSDDGNAGMRAAQLHFALVTMNMFPISAAALNTVPAA